MMRSSLVSVTVMVALVFAAFLPQGIYGARTPQEPAPEPPRYTLTDLGPTATTTETTFTIDSQGTVGGGHRGPEGRMVPAVYRDGKRTELPGLPEFPQGVVTGMQNTAIVGTLTDPTDRSHELPVVWKENVPTALPLLAGKYGTAQGINAQGLIVGSSGIGAGKRHACFWKNGTVNDLGAVEAGTFSQALAVNNAGTIVGIADVRPNGDTRAVVWEEGKAQLLPLLEGGKSSHARAINDRGQVVGWADDEEGSQAVLWENGKIRALGNLGDEPSSAWAINNRGDIVGGSSVNERVFHAFIWTQGKMWDLNDCLPPQTGWTLRMAQGINDRGQVVGVGMLRRERRVFLLTPVPGTPSGTIARPADATPSPANP